VSDCSGHLEYDIYVLGFAEFVQTLCSRLSHNNVITLQDSTIVMLW